MIWRIDTLSALSITKKCIFNIVYLFVRKYVRLISARTAGRILQMFGI
jgi:hypothetical protein